MQTTGKAMPIGTSGATSTHLGEGDVEIHDLKKSFSRRGDDDLLALDGINLHINAGEFVAIVGPSGCGKTTLLKIVAGMLAPSAGHITVGGQASRRSQIGFVFQQASLYPWRTVAENVRFGMELKARRAALVESKGAKRDGRTRVEELLALVGLEEFGSYYPNQISGGMQQRANLARALAIQPRVLLMDEPFSALDAQTREELQIELQRISVATSATTIFVTHDIREAVYLADKVVVLSGRPGRVRDIVAVAEPRPRRFKFQISDEFVDRFNHIWRLVHEPSPGGKYQSDVVAEP